MDYFKSNKRRSEIPSCILDLEQLSKFYEILDTINKEALEFEVTKLKEDINQLPNKPSEQEISNFIEKVKKLYTIVIQIYGSKGEYIQTLDKNIFDYKHLPDSIDFIRIDNTTLFESEKMFKQSYQFVIEIDMKKSAIFNISDNPSHKTENLSNIGVWGLKETWVEGTYNEIIDFFKKRSSRRGWIHKKNIYDIFLWFYFIPFSFWCLYKFDSWINSVSFKASNIFYVFIYLYFIFFLIFAFYSLFKYARWLFPIIELKSKFRSLRNIQRTIIVMIFSAIFISGIKELAFYLISMLK